MRTSCTAEAETVARLASTPSTIRPVPPVRGGAVVEEGAHGGGVVVVEDGQRLQVLGSHDGGVVVVVGRGEVFAGVGVDAHVGGDGGDGENDVQRRGEGVRGVALLPRNRRRGMTTGLCTVSNPGSETTRV